VGLEQRVPLRLVVEVQPVAQDRRVGSDEGEHQQCGHAEA